LTYTSSENLPQGTVSEGVSAVFPEESDIYATLKLKPTMINAAKANGDHICLEVTGGPKDEPVIISSELTSQPPQLKLEVQSLPKTEAEKAAAAKHRAAIEAKVAKEKAVEDHLRAQAVSKLTADELTKKGEALKTKLSQLRAASAQKESEQTTGAAFNTLKADSDAARDNEIQAKITTETATITAEEDGKMVTALTDSGLSGAARTNLENSLTTTKTTEIKKRVDAMKIEQTDAITLKHSKILSEDIEKIKARIAKELADDISAATTEASTLTDAQKATVDTEATAQVATQMADWRAGKLEVKLPDSEKVAAAKAADAMNGLTEDQRAALNSKVADEVAKAVPARLQAAVDAKMLTSQNEAVLAIQNQLKAASDTKVEADLAAQSVGKTDAEKVALKISLQSAATTALDLEITEKTTGSALSALQTQLRTDLSTQLRPAVKAELEASIMKTELAKAKVAASQAQNSAGDAELGSALDNAPSFTHHQ